MKTKQPASRATRSVPHTYSYGFALRIADRMAGWSDRRTIDRAEAEPTTTGPAMTAWIARLQATFDELDHQLLARTRDDARTPVRSLHELEGASTALRAQLNAASETMRHHREQPVASDRSGGELHLSQEAVAVRRTREWQAKVTQAEARHRALQQQLDATIHEAAKIRADIVERFDLACEISRRLEHYDNRRIGTYCRIAKFPGGQIPTIIPATWARSACPWLPPEDGSGNPDVTREARQLT